MKIFGMKITLRKAERVEVSNKQRVVENIEKANSDYYQQQKALHAVTNSAINEVIDNMMNDSYWSELIENYVKNGSKEDKVRISL